MVCVKIYLRFAYPGWKSMWCKRLSVFTHIVHCVGAAHCCPVSHGLLSREGYSGFMHATLHIYTCVLQQPWIPPNDQRYFMLTREVLCIRHSVKRQ